MAKHVPSHRAAPARTKRATSRRKSAVRTRSHAATHARPTAGVKGALAAAGVALVATALAVSGGVANGVVDRDQVAYLAGAEREVPVSRAADRTPAEAAKEALLAGDTGAAVVRSVEYDKSDLKELAQGLMPTFGLASAEFDCVDRIWTQESRWNPRAANPRSSAYGIPQALPGSKMSSFGADWRSNPETQIKWGLDYIKKRYGSACGAWQFKQRRGWY